jgi:hypothetical protein
MVLNRCARGRRAQKFASERPSFKYVPIGVDICRLAEKQGINCSLLFTIVGFLYTKHNAAFQV